MGVMGVSEFVSYRTRLRDEIKSSSNVNRFGQGGEISHYMRHLIGCFRLRQDWLEHRITQAGSRLSGRIC